jgi:hypothetical protein
MILHQLAYPDPALDIEARLTMVVQSFLCRV